MGTYNEKSTDIDNPKWNVIKVDAEGLKVAYQEKYGSLIEENAIGLWENDVQYMITFRDSRKVILEKSNVVSIGATEII